MPKRLFKFIEEMAWASKTSINFKLDDLIVEELLSRLQSAGFDASLGMYTGKKEPNDLKFLDEIAENEDLSFDKQAELLEIFREYRDWREANR